MNAEIRTIPVNDGRMEINLSIPSAKGALVVDALRSMLALSGIKVRRVDEDGEEVLSSKEVFPDGCPAMA